MRNLLFIFFMFQSFFCSSQETEKIIIHFTFNEYDLDPGSKNRIDRVVLNSSISKVHIEAHCDSFGSNQYNDKLSLKRALEVKLYLVSLKINENQIDIKAQGKRVPLNDNENKKARALNRRAEIFFVTSNSDSVHQSKAPFIDTPAVMIKSTETVSVQEEDPSYTKDNQPQGISTFDINKTAVGTYLLLENLNFYGGRHVLLISAQKTLKMLLDTLRAYPTLEIEIQGHICCEPGPGDGWDEDTFTKDLSVNRAKAVYGFLVKNGIASSRLSYKGFGAGRKLIKYELTEEDRTKNRRVEIKIIKK